MAKASLYFINGVVKLNGTDVATISAIDNSVLLTIAEEQKEFSGNRITPMEAHTISVRGTLKITKPVLKKEQLAKLLGMDEATGTLSDESTPSTNYKITLNEFFDRPEVEVLVVGREDKTGKILEIATKKAVLINDLELLLSKEDFSQPELEFLILGDDDNPDDEIFDVRFED